MQKSKFRMTSAMWLYQYKDSRMRLKVDTGSQVKYNATKGTQEDSREWPPRGDMQPQTGFHSGDNLTILGTVKLNVKSKSDVNQELTFYVAKKNQPGLLCFGSSQNLG